MSSLSEIEAMVPALRRYAWGLVRHTQDADDLVQDALVRALDHLPGRPADAPLRPWLFTILHNLVISRWRSARRRARVMATPDELPDAPVPPSQEWSLATRDLVAAFDTLPQEQRDVLMLVAVEGLEYREAAAVLGIPLGTVMSRLSRARNNLHGQMEGEKAASRPALRRVK